MATSNPNQSVVDDAWSSRAKRAIVAGPALLLLAALAATIAGLAYGGGATPLVVSDPGPIVMWGVPLARLAMNLSAAVTIGALVLAAWAASRHEPEFERSMTIAASAAIAWVVATAAAAFLTYLQISNAPLAFDAEFGEGLAYFFTSLELGQSWVMMLGMVVVLSIVVIAVRSPGMVGFAAVYATFCLWPLGSQGHAAGAENHETVVAGITLHYIGAALWLGGLTVIALLASRLSSVRRVALFERYSTLALIAFIIVATSGVVSSVANIGSVDQLLSPYGVLVLAKVAVFVVLGVIGWLQRRALIARMRSTASTTTSSRKPLVWLVTLELAFMGLASGAAAALGRTPSPVTEVPGSQLPSSTPAQLLTGEQLPPEFSPVRLLTEWRLDPMSTTIFLFGLFFYIAGIARLRARGELWPVRRTVALIASVLLGLYLVNGPLIVYGKFLFSLHMAQHLLLTLLVPLLFVLSAPLTLLVRTVRARGDGSYGTREWVLAGTHARTVTFLVHPVVAASVLSVSMIGFYYTPLLRWAVSDHVGHMWMIGYFLLAGWFSAQSIVGIDRIGPPIAWRRKALAAGIVSASFVALGIALLASTDLLAADWFGSLGRTWGVSAIVDQQIGGAVALIVGALLALAFGGTTLVRKFSPPSAPHQRPLAHLLVNRKQSAMTHSGTHARVRMPRPVALLAALVATLLLAVAGTLSVPSPAQAHDSLISTVPAPDDELAEPPASLTLTFSAGVLSLGDAAVVIVTAPDGTAISDGSPVIDGETVVQAVDASVDAGTYLVQWRVVSSDGHPISGEFSYTTSTSAAATPTDAPTPSASTTPEPVPQTSTSTAPASAAPETPEELTSFIVIAVLIFAGLVLVTVLLVIRSARQRTRARDEPESQQ